MDKYTTFIGQPIFLQLIKFIPRHIIRKIEVKHATNRYVKKFDGYNHLATLLFSLFARCDSLREISSGMLSQANRLSHIGIKYIARRSTLSDANARRNSEFFADIYYALRAQYVDFLSDSRQNTNSHLKAKYPLKIIDSTTITLFKEILKAAGPSPKNGKRKGGIKVHALIDSISGLMNLVVMTAAASNDVNFFENIKRLNLPKGTFLVFDKGYVSYKHYEYFSRHDITYVTKRIANPSCMLVEQRDVSAEPESIICDHVVEFRKKADKKRKARKITHQARCIAYREHPEGEVIFFQTNNFKISASDVVEIYHRRWQIETLFKQLKQNFELKYFLGDNENAIKSQIWAVLIANLLVSVVKKCVKRKCSFSGIVSLLRLHIMNYVSMIELLEDPDRSWIQKNISQNVEQNLRLFPT